MYQFNNMLLQSFSGEAFYKMNVENMTLFLLIVIVALTYIPGRETSYAVLYFIIYIQILYNPHNNYNIIVYSIITCIIYVGSPKMYGHMVKTRAKQFAENKKEVKEASKSK